MATTYNNLYLDTRARLKRAGVESAQLEAREIICYAADKSREQPRLPGLEDAPLGQQLGVHPGDEHVPGDVQGQAVKFPLPNDVGHRVHPALYPQRRY
mgnify:CR=1 FL=1